MHMKGRKTMYLKFLIISLSVIAPGCDDNNSLDDYTKSQIDSIEFKLVILDKNRNEKSVFSAGTDIRLAVMLNNKLGRDFAWENSYACQLLQQEDFFLVYRNSTLEQGGDSTPAAVGKPYVFPTSCPDINLPPENVPPGVQSVVSVFWSANPDNSPLPIGKYYTEFSYTLKIDGTDKVLELRADFEME